MSSTSITASKSILSLSTDSDGDVEGKALYVDIGANLSDPMYQGSYRNKERHEADLSIVLQRAWSNNLDQIIITGGTLEECKKGWELAKTDPRLFSTVGVHPTRCSEFGTTDESWKEHLEGMRDLLREGVEEGSIVAMGELGLDYARLEFCDVKLQKKGFIAQLQLAKELNLPLFLHNRDTGTDLLHILKKHYFQTDHDSGKYPTRAGGVVHSFDDTLELAQEFLDLGLYIGINGCSLKTADNLQVVKDLPLEKMLLETDCPWCGIRATHAGWEHVKTSFTTKTEKKYEAGCCVKSRSEPCHIIQVAEVIAGLKGISVEEVANISRKNAKSLFPQLLQLKQ